MPRSFATQGGSYWVLLFLGLVTGGRFLVQAATGLRIPLPETYISFLVELVVLVVAVAKLRKDNIKLKCLFGKLPSVSRVPLMLGEISLLVLLSLLFSVGVTLISFPYVQEVFPTFLNQSIDNILFFGLLISVMAPVTEEIIFRGILLHLWSETWTAPKAVLLSSLTFSLFHLQNVLGTFVFAITMSLLYLRTRTLLAPIAGHMIHNIVLFAFLSRRQETVGVVDTTAYGGLLVIAGTALVIMSLPLLFYIVRYWPEKKQTLPYVANQRTAKDYKKRR